MKKILLLIAVGAGMNLPALSHVDALAAWTRQAVYSHAWETNRLQQLAEDFAKAIEQNPADYDARIFRSIALGLSLAESAKAYFRQFGYAIDFGGILSLQGERAPAAKWPAANAVADDALAECKPVLGRIIEDLCAIPETWEGVVLSSEKWPIDETVRLDYADVQYLKAQFWEALGMLYFATAYDIDYDYVKSEKFFTSHDTQRGDESCIPVLASAPSLTSDAGWENAALEFADYDEGNEYVDAFRFAFYGNKLYVRFVTKHGAALPKDVAYRFHMDLYIKDRGDITLYFDPYDTHNPYMDSKCWWLDWNWDTSYGLSFYDNGKTLVFDMPDFVLKHKGEYIIDWVDVEVGTAQWIEDEWWLEFDELYKIESQGDFFITARHLINDQTGVLRKVRNKNQLIYAREYFRAALNQMKIAMEADEKRTGNDMRLFECSAQEDYPYIKDRVLKYIDRATVSLDSVTTVEWDDFNYRRHPGDVNMSDWFVKYFNAGLSKNNFSVSLAPVFNGMPLREYLPEFSFGTYCLPMGIDISSCKDPTFAGMIPETTDLFWYQIANVDRNTGLVLKGFPRGTVKPTTIPVNRFMPTDLYGLSSSGKDPDPIPPTDKPTVSVVVADGCEAMGKVSGGKTAKAGTKLTLKATANKGYVFSHWEGPLNDATDPRSPSVTYVTESRDVAFAAHFIPVADDAAAISFEMADEYAAGEPITLVAVDVSGCTSLPKVTVKGLPSGLKFTAKDVFKKGSKTEVEYPANTIYGTPTKSGVYAVVATVTTAGKKTASATQTIIVRKPNEKVVVPVANSEGGDVKGGGVYAVGKKVTLKATAKKGFVFAGWYEDASFDTPCDSAVADYRNPSYAYTMGGSDKMFYARFEPAANDMDLDLAVDGSAVPTTFTVSESTQLALDVESLSLPKISVKGLPAGMKFTAKPIYKKGSKTEVETPANTIYGAPTKPGMYKVSVSISNTSIKKSIVKQFTIEVPNLTGANDYFAEGLDNGIGKKCVLSVGISNIDDFLPSLKLNRNVKLAVSGLPAGLKYDAKTGKITGVATKAGIYTVTLTVIDGKEKYVSTITIEVEALPDWVVGTFEGYYILEGYHGPSKEKGVYNEYYGSRTDGCIHWEMAEPIYVKVDSKGKVIFEWPEPETVVESTGLQREGDGSFSFHFRFREHAGGPWLEYEEGSAEVVFYRNETLSKKIGFDVGEVECYLNGIDGYNDYYEEYYFAQKRSSDDFIKRAFSNVKGQYKTFEFKNVYSSADIHGHSFNGNLKVGIDSSGNVYSIWTPKDRPNVIKKTENSKFILRDYDSKNGDIYGEIAVLIVDFNNKEGDFMEYTLFFDVAVADGELYIIWDDSRVVIHE